MYKDAPIHIFIETGMVVFILWLVFIRKTADPKKGSKDVKFSKKEIDWLVKSWEPEPLIPELTHTEQLLNNNRVIVEGVTGENNKYLNVKGMRKPALNLSSFDFLGLSSCKAVKKATEDALNKYGCGSCGPRGFYGTIDAHLDFERELAKFMGVPEAISYSDSASAVSSAITAFSKRGDLLLVDEACNEAIRTGLYLSRATVQTYKHNDTDDLLAIMTSIAQDDVRKKRDASQQRRFIVTEGLFRNTGEICNLPGVLALKEKFFYRVIMDESMSFGVLGKSGRGVTEHYDMKVSDVEIITLAMDTVLASVGGVCIGTREIVDHQRLSGAGYCFSAASPPFLSAAAVSSLRELDGNPALLKKLRHNSGLLTKQILKIPGIRIKGGAADFLPIKHIALEDSTHNYSRDEQKLIMLQISKRVTELGAGITSCKFSMTDLVPSLDPSLRLCATAYLTEAEIKQVGKDLNKAVAETLEKAVKVRTRTESGNVDITIGSSEGKIAGL